MKDSESSPKFNSSEEEIAYLRSKVLEQENLYESKKEIYNRDSIISEKIEEHKKLNRNEVLEKPIDNADAIVLDLAPKGTDKKIEELLGLLDNKGLLNTLSVLENMNDPELEDDFHRVLVQYIKKNLPVKGVAEKSVLFHSLRMTLFEVTLPYEESEKRSLKEILSSMEQFFAGIMPNKFVDGSRWFSFEIAVASTRRDVVFYVAVPDEYRSVFEKQLTSIFSSAKIKEEKNDYNIFTDHGYVLASHATYKKNAVFRIKVYNEFDYDPLTVLINSFSKLEETGEGASVQFLVAPPNIDYLSRYKKALVEIDNGRKVEDALYMPETLIGEVGKGLLDVAKQFASSEGKGKDDKKSSVKEEEARQAISQKVESPIFSVVVRIVVSAKEKSRALQILSDIESAFHQFENTSGNSLDFKKYENKKLQDLVQNFSFRLFEKNESLPMSTKEIATLVHFPTESARSVSELKHAKAGSAPAPQEMTKEGILLGMNRHRNQITDIYFSPQDRLRHFYVIGQTGTGKSNFLKTMIIQDIKNGEGVCMIDPHGTDIEDVLASVPKERFDDVIYFDPSYTMRPMGLNMLEYDERFPEQKTFVVNELISIFNKLFDMKMAGGPAFEQYFRNSALLVMEHPASGNTLIEIGRVLGDKAFRELKLSHCKNPIVLQFWRNAEKTSGEQSLANFVPYVTSKFDNFISNDIMRPVIAQEKSSFNFRNIMDNKKILLVNLAKGRLGDINANLIGLILVGKILMAALSRVDSFGKNLPAFYLYIDEFQNITTDSIATILSEARKYKLSLNIAHQFIAQLEEKIRDAVFGNVGSMGVFRIGADDAEYMKKQFEPTFSEKDIMNLDNYNAYLKMLVNGRPAKPFNIETLPMPEVDHEVSLILKELSYEKYGKDRAEVEDSIMARYRG